jgi:hypothetical protein
MYPPVGGRRKQGKDFINRIEAEAADNALGLAARSKIIRRLSLAGVPGHGGRCATNKE